MPSGVVDISLVIASFTELAGWRHYFRYRCDGDAQPNQQLEHTDAISQMF